MWYVILFNQDNTVAVIPNNWFIEEKSECLWPSPTFNKKELEKFVKNKFFPLTDWKPFKAKILGQCDDYETALRKLKKALEKDNLTSTDQEEGQSKKRKRTLNKKYMDARSDTDKETDDSSGNNSDDGLSYPSCPNDDNSCSATINVCSKMTGLQSYSNNAKEKNNSDRKPKTHKSKTTFYRTYSRSLSPPEIHSREESGNRHFMHQKLSASFSQRSDHQISSPLRMSERSTKNLRNDHQQFSELSKTSGGCTKSSRPEDVINYDQSSVISILNEMISSERKFREEVFRKLNVINIKLLDLEKHVQNMKKDNIEDLTLENEAVLQLIQLFPMDRNKLEQMEEALSSKPEVQNSLAKELSRLGGTDTSDIVKRLMYKIFTNEVGQEFSWDGAKGKKKFKNLKITSIIFHAVRLNNNTKDATQADIIIFIKKWLVRCKDRIKSAENKKLRLSEDQNDLLDTEAI